MTGTRPTFLSRLAPSVATAPYAVRAALPARYASGNAMFRFDEQVETVIASEIAQSRADPHAQPSPAGEPPTVSADGALAQREVELPAPPPFAADKQLPPASLVDARSHETAKPISLNSGPVRAPLPLPPEIGAAPTEVLRPGRPPSQSVDHRPNPANAPALAPDGPLSPGTVIERALAARRAEGELVTVTIDRIDFRMPPEADQTNGRAAPRRRAAPTISLSDYLRGGDSTPRRRG